jgi:hypothetical protein
VVPTIVVIVVIRNYLAHGLRRSQVAFGIAALAAVSALFLAAQFRGTMPLPEADFVQYLKGRMSDPSRTDLLQFSYIWYQPLAKEIADTWLWMPHNILGIPVFALLILAAYAGMALFRGNDPFPCQRDAPSADCRRAHRREPGLSRDVHHGVRLFALDLNWAVCMFLILHAVKTLPTTQQVPPIPIDDRNTNIFGLVITLIPRVGIVRPF